MGLPNRDQNSGSARERRSAITLVLALLLLAAWMVAPRLFQHWNRTTPVSFESFPIEGDLTPERNFAFSHEGIELNGWSPRAVSVTAGGKPLERTSARRVRKTGDGTFHIGQGGRLLVAPPGNQNPTALEIEVSQPRDLPPRSLVGALSIFVFLHVGTLVALARQLWTRPLLRALPPVILAMLSGLLTLHAANAHLPPSRADSIGERQRQFAQAIKNESPPPDTVFLGSSVIYRQLDPATFDDAFAHAKRPRRSFNLGAAGARMPEVLHLASWALERGEGQIDLLVVEPRDRPFDPLGTRRLAARSVAWHTSRALWMVARGLHQDGIGAEEAALRMSEHLPAWGRNTLALGRGLDGLDALFAVKPRWINPSRRGFLPLDLQPNLARRHATFLDRPKTWERAVEELLASHGTGTPTSAFELEMFLQLEHLAAEHGADVVWLIAPHITRRPNMVYAHDQGHVETLLRFDDPQEHSRYYDLSARFDAGHLNQRAALLWSRDVAERILALERDSERVSELQP